MADFSVLNVYDDVPSYFYHRTVDATGSGGPTPTPKQSGRRRCCSSCRPATAQRLRSRYSEENGRQPISWRVRAHSRPFFFPLLNSTATVRPSVPFPRLRASPENLVVIESARAIAARDGGVSPAKRARGPNNVVTDSSGQSNREQE